MIAPNDTRNWQVSMDDPAAIVEGVDDIVQSINIILTTIPGSDPLRPEFGSNVYQYLDKPLPSVLGKIIYEATTAIGRWEKRLDVTRISASRSLILYPAETYLYLYFSNCRRGYVPA